MAAIKACALRSGSSGNAIFIGSARTRLLVDAGVCCRTIEESLRAIGESAADLDGCLITHEHADHIQGVGPLLRRYKIPLYVNWATWLAMRPLIGPIDESLVCLIEHGEPSLIGDLLVSSFPTSHDAADPAGYCIEGGNGRLAVLTDAGHLDAAAMAAVSGCRTIFLEANYDQAMLLAGTYPDMLKQRILGRQGHLSNDDCAAAACTLCREGTSHVILSHISKDNNFPELALLAVSSRLYDAGIRPGTDCRLSVAQRYAVSEPCLT